MRELLVRKYVAVPAIFAIVSLLLLAPPPATAGITLGPTIDLPWSSAVDFMGGSVALLANGNFAIATTRADIGQFYAHQVQFFNADGQLLSTHPILHPADERIAIFYVTVGSLGARYLVITQVVHYSHGWVPNHHAYAQLYDEAGQPLGAQVLWPSSAIPDFGLYYHFGSAPLWEFLPITYTAPYLYNNIPVYPPHLRIAVPNPAPAEPPIEIAPPVQINYIEDAAINGRGRFALLAYRSGKRGLQIFDRAGKPRTPFLTARVPQTPVRTFVAINAQGQVLLWFSDSAGHDVVRLYDERGAPASEVVALTNPPALVSPVRDAKGLDDGSFVLGWIRRGSTAFSEELLVALFDSQTKTVGEPVRIATSPDQFREARLELNSDGTGIVVWEGGDGYSGPFSGHARLITVTP
jgi:hypothetical protein